MSRSPRAASPLAIALALAVIAVACGDPVVPITTPGPSATPASPRPTRTPRPPPGHEGLAPRVAAALAERSGLGCVGHRPLDEDGFLPADLEALAAGADPGAGFLGDVHGSYLGTLEAAFAAWGLESIGLEFDDFAYGIGQYPLDRPPSWLPPGTWWAPVLVPFELRDGRSGWTFGFGYTWAVECENPATPAPLFPADVDIRPDQPERSMVDVLRYVSGRTCYHTYYREPGLSPDFVAEWVAANPSGDGFLDPRRTLFAGSLADFYAAWELVSIGLETAEVAYGLGRVLPERGPYFPPVESWWFPEVRPIDLPDGRSGWYWNGGFVAAPWGCRDGEIGSTSDAP